MQYLKYKLPLSPIKAFPARSSWATISPLVQLAKAGFLISIKTRGVKWEVLIKRVWSTSKEVAEVCGKKHSCQLLQNACEPRGVPGSERTPRLAGDCPHYPRQRVHPLTLRSNPPPASTPRVPYSQKLIYLGSFHWKTIKPLGFARDQSVIAPVVSVSKSIASLDAVAAYSDKAALCWKESPQQLQIRDWAKYRKWCMQDSILLSSWREPLLGGDATCTQTCPTDPCIWLEALALFWTGVNISGDAPITLSTRGDRFCQGPRLRCGLGLSQAGSPCVKTRKNQDNAAILSSTPWWSPSLSDFSVLQICVIPENFKCWLPETILLP